MDNTADTEPLDYHLLHDLSYRDHINTKSPFELSSVTEILKVLMKKIDGRFKKGNMPEGRGYATDYSIPSLLDTAHTY